MTQREAQAQQAKTKPRAVLRMRVDRADGTVDDYGVVAHYNPVIHWLMQVKIRYKNWRYARRVRSQDGNRTR